MTVKFQIRELIDDSGIQIDEDAEFDALDFEDEIDRVLAELGLK